MSNKHSPDKILHFKTIWMSDLHLGTKGCQDQLILEFIKYTRSDKLYLIGDIIDVGLLEKNGIGHKHIMILFRKF